MREYRLLLSDILQAAEDIQKFTYGISRENFVADEKTRSAVLYKFAVMGEATKLLPEQVRGLVSRYPLAEYRRAAGQSDSWIYRCGLRAPVGDDR